MTTIQLKSNEITNQFDEVYPRSLTGYLTPDEFQSSISRINEALGSRPHMYDRLRITSRFVCAAASFGMILGIVLLILASSIGSAQIPLTAIGIVFLVLSIMSGVGLRRREKHITEHAIYSVLESENKLYAYKAPAIGFRMDSHCLARPPIPCPGTRYSQNRQYILILDLAVPPLHLLANSTTMVDANTFPKVNSSGEELHSSEIELTTLPPNRESPAVSAANNSLSAPSLEIPTQPIIHYGITSPSKLGETISNSDAPPSYEEACAVDAQAVRQVVVVEINNNTNLDPQSPSHSPPLKAPIVII